MVKVLIVAPEPVGAMMTGPAIRCWELASVLASSFDVTLAAPGTPDMPVAGFRLEPYQFNYPDSLASMAREAEAIVVSGYLLVAFPSLSQADRPLIVDIYDPFPVENLGLHRQRSIDERMAINESDFRAMKQLLQAGDFFLCGSEHQRNFYLGMLGACGRINPRTYQADPSYRRLIDVVSMGIPERPATASGPLKGNTPGIEAGDFLLVWPGGLWEWLDPLTAVEAVHLLAGDAPDIKLLFPGIRHPHPDRVGAMETPDAVLKRARDLGLLGRQVFYNDWTPYGERARYLTGADVALSLHFDSLESNMAIRARLLDCLWAGMPVVSTRGDVIAESMAERGLAKLVPEGDPYAVAEAILSWRSEGDNRAELAGAFQRMSEEYRWPVVSRPLAAFLREQRRAADRRDDSDGDGETASDASKAESESAGSASPPASSRGWEMKLPANGEEMALAEALQRLRDQQTELLATRDLLHRMAQGKVLRFMNASRSLIQSLVKKLKR